MKENQPLETLTDIRRIMDRSSRFLSLSGWSGVAAGICGSAGAFFARRYVNQSTAGAPLPEAVLLKHLLYIALLTLAAALASGWFFTWQKSRREHRPLWDKGARNLLINLFIPLVAGGAFIAGLIFRQAYHLLVPACLVFYGLALINASKYTLKDIRYLGLLEIWLGIACLFFDGLSFYFWVTGFGVLHIIYGLIMWKKYA